MAHFCWYLKLVFLLWMLSNCEGRPANQRQSELIAGNEFLKLFLGHDAQQRSLHSNEYEGPADSARSTSARSLEHKTRFRNANRQHETDDEGKQVVKLVTTGSKIVFLDDAPQAGPAKAKTKTSDEVKVVAVSVSSSSKRGGKVHRSSTTHAPLVKTTRRGSGSNSISSEDFINRSHKSELSIEEAEPLTMESDSLNSASNIQNVLASPLVSAASTRSMAYHSSGRNATAAHINQSQVRDVEAQEAAVSSVPSGDAEVSEDKLLPFQTVIYHDTKQGHGPQSRSISYSSISQNVDDLQVWQQSGSILAEAQRNVSESLKPIPRRTHSEPSKFYSVPAKMYSVPAKFYSEPSKVYSEPSKVYGQPEKVYSEPAKVYGQPSKFYSEPAKVYSQPAKVYGEPAKTYWPQTVTGSTTGSSATTTTTTSTTTTRRTPTTVSSATMLPAVTVPTGSAPSNFVPSRRPAIVSRIAFGEAHSSVAGTTRAPTTTTPATTTTTTSSSGTSATVRPATWQQHYHNHNQQQQFQSSSKSSTNSQPRRVLFNLDKLPYDLLNAPQPILSKGPSEAPLVNQQYHSHGNSHSHSHSHNHQTQQQPRPCWEQRQHSSLSVQHSNQNAKGLPNRDLVKCVSKFAHQQHATSAAGISAYSYSSSSTSTSSSSSSSSAGGNGASLTPHFTTERAELFTPTPEQNYEIEESVSVMTNGRAHGVQGGGGREGTLVTATTPATLPTTTTTALRNRNRGIDRGRGTVVYNANANANDYDDGGGGGGEDDAGEGNGGTEADGGGESDEDKVAYVVEGRNYRKYRVEEKTDDGFIVGEYGVVDHNDGNLRGVRYTADSTINRSLIQKALLTFLKLK